MTEHEPARTLAAYAVALLHGADLASFEEANLIALAESVGVTITPAMVAMRRAAQVHALEQKESLEYWRSRALAPKRSLWSRLWQ